MWKTRGFSLLDLMVTLVVASILVAVSIPAYDMFVQRAYVARAIGDIGKISLEIEMFRLRNNDRIPLALNELPTPVPLDPWGRPYSYLNIPSVLPNKGPLRKDKNLNPLNTDFDLYSTGKDGSSAGPLSAKASRDDIIRANDGAFFGLGKDY
ncbi:MAG TPA: prepilin-type cleavage/methylation domain-containing protein [Woeseiaceae bacterium]|nr:prepilin-type cleavage/methylation domain-containing protein [Woeseiaceae bacterium]